MKPKTIVPEINRIFFCFDFGNVQILYKTSDEKPRRKIIKIKA
jgi:hypothetical protein